MIEQTTITKTLGYLPRSASWIEEMEERSRRRIRDLVTHLAFQGLVANETGCVRISMMAGNKRSLQRAEYRCARPITSRSIKSSLHRAAGPYKWVKSVAFGDQTDVRYYPESDRNSDRPDGR